MQPPSYTELKNVFDFLSRQSYNGCQGVYKFDSGVEGPTVAVSICVHGNEPCGLAAFWYMLKGQYLEKELVRGSVIFILANPQATAAAFDNDASSERGQFRYIDLNLNRIPLDIAERMVLKEDTRYEILRITELYEAVLQEIDFGLDIHSVTQPAPAIAVGISKKWQELITGMPVGYILTGCPVLKDTKPLADLFGGIGSNIPSLLVECGQHEDPASYVTSINCVLSILHGLALVRDAKAPSKRDFREYELVEALRLPNESYSLTKVFANFEEVKKGQLIAYGDGADFVSPCDGHVFFAWPSLKPPYGSQEESLFITKKAVLNSY